MTATRPIHLAIPSLLGRGNLKGLALSPGAYGAMTVLGSLKSSTCPVPRRGSYQGQRASDISNSQTGFRLQRQCGCIDIRPHPFGPISFSSKKWDVSSGAPIDPYE
jgi:hypothetical protein